MLGSSQLLMSFLIPIIQSIETYVSIDYIIGIKNDIKSCELPNIKEFNIEERTKSTLADRLKQIMRERNIKQVDILEACKPYCKKYGVKLEKNDLSQ